MELGAKLSAGGRLISVLSNRCFVMATADTRIERMAC